MSRKIIIISIIIVIIFFHKFIIFKLSIFAMEKWINKDIYVKKFDILYNQNKIIIENIKIFEKNDKLKLLFFTKKIEIEFRPKSLFSKLIIIQNIEIEAPIMNLYFEMSNEQSEIMSDNIGILENLKDKDNPKIYPKKIIDINFLILSAKLEKFKVNIFRSDNQKKININLSDIFFAPFGNEKGYQHYKDIFKIILVDITMRIPDKMFKEKIIKKYGI